MKSKRTQKQIKEDVNKLMSNEFKKLTGDLDDGKK